MGSSAISRYLARHLGMMGTTEAEGATIDAMCEHVVDIKAAWRKLFPYKKTLTDEEVEANDKTWFTTPATPPLENRAERQLRWFLGHIEGGLAGDGFSVGGRPSLADACLFNLLGEHAPEVAGRNGQPFGDAEATGEVLQDFPKLQQVVATFRKSPGMEHYLATRGN